MNKIFVEFPIYCIGCGEDYNDNRLPSIEEPLICKNCFDSKNTDFVDIIKDWKND